MDASMLLSRARDSAGITRRALEQNLIQPAEVERILKRRRAKGLSAISQRIHDAVVARADAAIENLGLPPNRGPTTCYVTVQTDGVSVDAHHYDMAHARSLLRASPAVRKRVIDALYGTGLPIILAHDLFEMSYAWGEAINILPQCAQPTDDQLRASWKVIVEQLDGEPMEPDPDDPSAEPEHSVYGIGTYHSFEYLARRICCSRASRNARPAKRDPKVDKRWNAIADRLIAATPAIRAWNFRDASEQRDGRPFEEAFIVSLSADDDHLISVYFEEMNDGSGEIPSLWFDHQDESTILRATLFPKIASAVMALIATGDKP